MEERKTGRVLMPCVTVPWWVTAASVPRVPSTDFDASSLDSGLKNVFARFPAGNFDPKRAEKSPEFRTPRRAGLC